MKKNQLYIITLLIFFLSASLISYGTNYDDKLKNVKQNIKEVQNEKATKQGALKELNHTMIVLDAQIDESEKRIDSTNQSIVKKQSEIAVTEKEIDKYRKNIDKNTDLLSDRLKVMYRTSDIDYLRVILDSENMGEAISNMTMIKKIVKRDKEVLEELQASKEKIEVEKSSLEKQERQMLSLKAGLEAEKNNMERAMAEQEKNKALIKNDLAKLELMEDQMMQEANALESKIRELQRASGLTGAYKGGSMAWPVASGGKVTSTYGGRTNPISKRQEFHSGIDLAAPAGTGILAANSGKVIFAGNRGTYGKAILVDHGGGIVTLYAHCSAFVASEGQMVTKGQVIAKVGSTGYSTGPHLHFEVRVNGKHVNPSGYIGLR